MSEYTYHELMQDPSFKRWVNGEASVQEKTRWDRWVEKDPANRSLALKAQQDVIGFLLHPVTDDDTSVDEAWHRVQDQIDKKYKSKNYRILPIFKKESIVWTARIAAGFLLMIIFSFLVARFDQTPPQQLVEVIDKEVTTDFGEQKIVRLSDGSKIILNGNSRINYTTNKYKPTEINLFLEGEAFFSVSQRTNPGDAPFQVKTEEGVITVLGTRFVVSTRNNRTRVALEEGSVALSPLHLDTETLIHPGELAEFNHASDSVSIGVANLEAYTSWINGRLYFEKASIEEVMERLENTFGVKVIIRDSSLYAHEVSGSIENSNIKIITSALSVMLNASVQESNSGDVIYLGDRPEDE